MLEWVTPPIKKGEIEYGRVRILGLPVRVLSRDLGALWFGLKDVCAVLSMGNTARAWAALDQSERRRMDYYTDETHHHLMQFMDLSGLWGLILRSSHPKARTFRQWLTGYILPHVFGCCPDECNLEVNPKLLRNYIQSLPK